MSIKDDVLQTNAPTHLTCPYCPAQAFVKHRQWVPISQLTRILLIKYSCPAKHEFYVEGEKSNAN